MSAGCEYYEELLLRLPDSDLTDDEADALQEHLRTCADCRRLFRALKSAHAVLPGETREPPEDFAETVMARITADKSSTDARRAAERRAKANRKRRWRGFAAAACFVLVLGGAAFGAARLLNRGSSTYSAAQESIALDMGENALTADAAPAEAPVPAVEARAQGADTEMPAAEEALEAEYAADTAAAARISWQDPSHVAAGREADFEAIVADSGDTVSMTAASWDVIAYVEYNGVIYEFLTDDRDQTLLWRDAAEGMFPTVSPKTADDLWNVIE